MSVSQLRKKIGAMSKMRGEMERTLILDAQNIQRQMVPGGVVDTMHFAAGSEELTLKLSDDPNVAALVQPGFRYRIRIEIESLLKEVK